MLKGQLVTLTSLRPDDSEPLFKWINDPDLIRNSAPFLPVHFANHEAWFKSVVSKPNFYIFAVRFDDRLVGSCQLFDVSPIHRSAELQIRISIQGKGYGTDAVRLLLGFAKRDLGLHSVWLRVFTTNKRAIRCYEKSGFKITGTLPEYAFVNGEWRDMSVMAIVF